MNTRTILHCDLNGFFASVEEKLNPDLKNVPMAVGGNEENRHGIILAKNELAKAFNIKTAETIWAAKKKCPDLIIIPPQHEEYVHYSRLVNKIYCDYTDMVEPFGIDESWLDVTASKNLFGDGKTIADTLRARIKNELDLTISVGVSFNKIFAKLGSDYKKPDATTIIDTENYKEIVYPLPVTDLFFVGGKTAERLKNFRIKTIGDLAGTKKEILMSALGKQGEMIWDFANGLDNDPVKTIYDEHDLKSVGNSITFKRDLIGYDDIKTGVIMLSDEVAMRLRKHGLACYSVAVSIKDPDFKTLQRQKTLKNPTCLSSEIAKTAMELIRANWNEKKPIRLIAITAKSLVKEGTQEQISMFDEKDTQKQENLEQALFELRKKYGNKIVVSGKTIKNDIT